VTDSPAREPAAPTAPPKERIGERLVREGVVTEHAALAAAVVLIVAALLLAPRAEARVYWANTFGDSIGRADLDGTGIDPSFIGAKVRYTPLVAGDPQTDSKRIRLVRQR
jgi:hypothetical protein